ncbi:MAG: hypothetical protein ABS36_10835 [Acidobacteria bacterium SCN 69-37]|nr:MAG: hypothetical protein ABS36_10835 [Acidobacteria bacterium SCN 69-37]
MSGFDRVARIYRWLEYVAFGSSLQRARTAHLPALADCRDILVIGDGDGRAIAQLAVVAAHARIHSIDMSDAMLREAAQRLPAAARDRVTFARADVRTFDPGHHAWDAVLTMFVLDCLTEDEVRRVVTTLAGGLRPGGRWLFADFAIPERGWRRLRARVWIACLYWFFRWRADLAVSRLPASEAIITAAGFVPVAVDVRQAGMIRSICYEREGA